MAIMPSSQTAMENCLTANPDINVVYTINEPTAAGANTALKAAGIKPEDVVVVSVDGGCHPGLTGVEDGTIDATSQQYPLLMASMGVDAVVDYIKTGKKVSGYTDTGVNLIAKNPVPGVDSKDVAFGLEDAGARNPSVTSNKAWAHPNVAIAPCDCNPSAYR